MKLIDTSVALDHLMGDLRATALLGQLISDQVPILASELTRAELVAIMRSDERDLSERFFAILSWVPVNEHIARVAGDLAQGDGSDRDIGVIDYLVAATALVCGAELVTTTARRYPMLEGVRTAYPARRARR